MKDIDELSGLMTTLLTDTGAVGKEFSDKSRSIISEIAEYARTTKAYQRAQECGKELECERTAEKVYEHLLVTIAEAPTTLHTQIACLLLIPILDDILKEGGKSEG